jgi:hypothetical protein
MPGGAGPVNVAAGAFQRIDIRGMDGASLQELWKDGPQIFTSGLYL